MTLGNLDPDAEIQNKTLDLKNEILNQYQPDAWDAFSLNGRHEVAAENHVKPVYQALSDAIQP